MIGIILKSTALTQKTLQIFNMIEDGHDITLFTHIQSKFSVNNNSEFPLNKLWYLNHCNLVYTTFDDAIFAHNLPTKVHKIFYVWDLDWHEKGFGYTKNKELMLSADRLLCRCEDHAHKIEQYCGRKPEILEEFNYEVLNESR